MSAKHTQKKKVSLISVHFVGIVLVILNCGTSDEEAKNDNRNLHNSTSTFIYNMIPENNNAIISPEYSKAINTFSVNLLDRVYNDEQFFNKNLVLCPFSVSRNLAVLTEGTTGESKQELLVALGGQTALDDAKDALSQLLYADNSVILQCADAIWINSNNYSLKPSFRNTVNSKYGVEIAGLDFTDVSGTVKTINDWTSNNTNSCIKEIINEKDISNLTAAFLVNAIYFEADWTSPFDITKTAKQDFFSPAGTVEVDMMSSNYYHKVFKTDRYENAKLFYGTNNKDFFYLDIYMPTTVTIESFIRDYCLSALGNQDSLPYQSIQMPRFFFTTEVKLIPMLQQLGIKGIFDPSQGEITEMVDGSAANLYVNDVKQKAGIKTDEEGTKAFAVTVTGTETTSGDGFQDVIFNRPFIYFIRAGENGLVLFAGIVNNPSANDRE